MTFDVKILCLENTFEKWNFLKSMYDRNVFAEMTIYYLLFNEIKRLHKKQPDTTLKVLCVRI